MMTGLQSTAGTLARRVVDHRYVKVLPSWKAIEAHCAKARNQPLPKRSEPKNNRKK